MTDGPFLWPRVPVGMDEVLRTGLFLPQQSRTGRRLPINLQNSFVYKILLKEKIRSNSY